jgi:hypothetical protein
MSKVKSKDVRIFCSKKCGKNYNVPKDICPVIERLDSLDFVRHIQIGDFRNSQNCSEIVGYDEKSRNYHINVSKGRFEQKIVLSVHDKKLEYEDSIIKCF